MLNKYQVLAPAFARNLPKTLGLLVVLSLSSLSVFAQTYSFDARRLALGGVTNAGKVNSVFEMNPRKSGYRSIVIPFGLIQALRNTAVFDPNDVDFDLVRAIDYVANPLHLAFDRTQGDGQFDFLGDIRNAQLDRDLNSYRGFTPPETLVAEGLFAPSWGYTAKFLDSHGIYLGVGPYLAVGTDLRVDPRLVDILGSDVDVPIPATTFPITNRSSEQVAMAITGGYRAKFGSLGRAVLGESNPNGIYFAVNYHYLKGFRYDELDINLNLETDSAGLLTLSPTSTPLVIDQLTSTSGQGFALDFEVGAIRDNWEFGLAAKGVANRINWKELKLTQFDLTNLLSGQAFANRSLPAPVTTIEVNLPTRYSGNVGYHATTWSVLADLVYGFEDFSFHGGTEYRLSRLEFRAGSSFSRDSWHPTGGVGLNLTRRLSIDVALFSTNANVEGVPNLAFATSLRINPSRSE